MQHSVVLEQQAQRFEDIEPLGSRDKITSFAGSMHLSISTCGCSRSLWMLLAESSPWPTLTPIVSLKAITLSTLVMIGQTVGTRSSRPKPTTTTITTVALAASAVNDRQVCTYNP